ncbi:histidine kinase [Larkinella soli]|uniref:histidine kinase n=1 Tax=Larkinella soli TaxID=1770527 RepID=UPI000FFB7161|nr:histidine kinase [Larkinella soli]
MKTTVLSFIAYLFFMPVSAVGQAGSEIDSLERLLPRTPRSEQKIKLFADLSWAYAVSRMHPDRARQYADSIRRLADELGSESGRAEAGFYYGTAARYAGDYARALLHFRRYVNYQTAVGDSSAMGRGLYQMAVIQSIQGAYDQALATYYRLLPIYEKLGNRKGVGAVTMAIGIQFENRGNYPEAIRAYEKARALFDRLDNKTYQVDVRVNLANVYVATRRYDHARLLFQQALQLDQALGNDWGVATDLCSIGIMLNHLHRPDSALVVHRQALEKRLRIPQKNEQAVSLYHVGYTYLLLKNDDLARRFLDRALRLSTETKARPLMRDTYARLSELYAERNDYARAYAFHRRYAALQDSLLNEETTRQLNELQVRYETGEKDRRIALLAREKEIQKKEAERQSLLRKAALAGLAITGLLAVLVVYIYRQRLRNQRILAVKNDEIRQAQFQSRLSELEMKALRAQINPHFLFNCLNSINRMVLQGDTENASRYLVRFSKLIRRILENTETTTVSLENELALLESYIRLEELRFRGKIDFRIEVDTGIEPEQTYLPSMILQPFVENAIWHGLMHRDVSGPGRITIAVREQDDRLCCTIEDNGVGREKARMLEDTGDGRRPSMGMRITEERLRLLSREGLQQLVRITDLKDSLDRVAGTRVDIQIPLAV